MEQNRHGKSMVEYHRRRRWNSLPYDIVFKIISHLHLPKDLAVDVSATTFKIEQSFTSESYVNWTVLDNLFTLFSSPFIETFSLELHANNYDNPRCWRVINLWLCRLCSRPLQRLVITQLGYRELDYQPCPSTIFRIPSLVSLELDLRANGLAWTDPDPQSINLPNLKKLSLCSFNYNYLGEFLSCCPSLESLSIFLNEPQESSVLSIRSKSLQRLSIDLYLKSSVEEIIIDAPILSRLCYHSSYMLSRRMLDSISHIDSLDLGTVQSTKFYQSAKKIKTVFPNLTNLSLTSSAEVFQEIFARQMLHCPNLERVELEIVDNNDEMMMMMWDRESRFVAVEQVKRLKLWTTGRNRFSKQVLSLVRWLLRSAKLLEKLVLHAHVSILSNDKKWQDLEKARFYQTVFDCVESTSRCEIEFLGEYKKD